MVASLKRARVLYGETWTAQDADQLAKTLTRLALVESIVLGELLEVPRDA
jgi:hypothetical protein